jgi:UDP-N-acetylglucosamine pyrophosphorylase
MFHRDEIKYLHLCPVDNVLVKLADPVEIGYVELNDLFISSKVLRKENQDENLGTHSIIDGQISVIGKNLYFYVERV